MLPAQDLRKNTDTEINSTVGEFQDKLKNYPPSTQIKVIVKQVQKNTNNAFQALLNNKLSKGKRPVVDVLQEIRAND